MDHETYMDHDVKNQREGGERRNKGELVILFDFKNIKITIDSVIVLFVVSYR